MFISSTPVPPNSYELRLHLAPADGDSRRPYVASAVVCVQGEDAELRLLTARAGVDWRAAERALLNWCRGMGVLRIRAERLLGRRLHWSEIAPGRFARDVPLNGGDEK